MITKRVLKASFVAGVAGALIGAVVLPMFDERTGAPGIPDSLEYAMGNAPGADLIKATLYGLYAAGTALIIGTVIEHFSDPRSSNQDPR